MKIKLIAATLALCATLGCSSKQAALIRTELATEARVESAQAAAEVQSLINYAIQTQTQEAYSALDSKFRTDLQAAQSVADPALSADLASRATSKYFRDKEVIDQQIEQDALRMSLIRVKIDNVGLAVAAVNQMAETEASIGKETIKRSINTAEVQELVNQITTRIEAQTASPELGGK